MIKINLDSTPKGKTKHIMKGSVEVSGKTTCLAHEIYSVLKNLKKVLLKRLKWQWVDEFVKWATNWRKNNV